SVARVFFLFFFYSYLYLRDLHSFPTRRSSDLRDCGLCGPFFRLLRHDDQRNDAARAVAARLMLNHRGDRDLMLAEHAGNFRQHRSEEHTSELQSLAYLVCRLLLEKKKKKHTNI